MCAYMVVHTYMHVHYNICTCIHTTTLMFLLLSPALTWRDVQYLIVYTSNTDPLVSLTDDEFTNGAGLIVSHQFGFGAIDADAMVTRAQRWINVPSQVTDYITPSVTSG